MGKRKEQREALDKAEQKVERARIKFEVAQAKQVQARERGKQEIERARLQAAEWQAMATERVEERARKLERAEQRVAELTDHGMAAPDLLEPDHESAAAQAPTTPEAVADTLEQREARHEPTDGSPVMVSGGLNFVQGEGRA